MIAFDKSADSIMSRAMAQAIYFAAKIKSAPKISKTKYRGQSRISRKKYNLWSNEKKK